MKRILVTGASGQIGSELVPALRDRYGPDNVIAGWHTRQLPDEILKIGVSTRVDVSDVSSVEQAIKHLQIDAVFHLSSILSALAEQKRNLNYRVNINGLLNVLEVADAYGLERVIIPSSIAAFGPGTPRANTPNDTVQKPNTLYWAMKPSHVSSYQAKGNNYAQINLKGQWLRCR